MYPEPWEVLTYSFHVDLFVVHWGDFLIGFVSIVLIFYWCWFVSLGLGEVYNREHPKS